MPTSTRTIQNRNLSSDVIDFAIIQLERRYAAEIDDSGATSTSCPTEFLDAMYGTLTAAGDDSTASAVTSGAVARSYWALFLLLFPLATAFGNVLVCVSVYSERSLRTVTNYFIVSLAVADIMVAVLVMPPAVYVEVNNAEWELGDILCDTWVAFDVMSCTASILNLTAISVDRFAAVTRPLSYARQKSSRRVYVMIAIPWIVSIAISSPIVLGLNYSELRSETPTLCTFYNSDFLIYSSMGSFFIPSLMMTVLYSRIYLVIRSRSRGAPGGGARGRGGRSLSAPSQGGGGPSSAWRPSVWSRAIESCSFVAAVTPHRFTIAPIPTTTMTPAVVGLPTTSVTTVGGRKVAPVVDHLPTDRTNVKPSNSSELQFPTVVDDLYLPTTTAVPSINTEYVRSRDQRCSVTSSSGDSSRENDENDDECVPDGLLPLMSCPGSSTTTMIVGTPVDDVDRAADEDRDGRATIVDTAMTGASGLRVVGAFSSTPTRTPESAGRSAYNHVILTSVSVTLTLPTLVGKDSSALSEDCRYDPSTKPQSTTTARTMMTSLTVPGSTAIGNGRSTVPISYNKSENSICRVGGEVSMIDEDDWTVAAASVAPNADGRILDTSRGSNEDGGGENGPSSRFNRQPSSSNQRNHRLRQQQQQHHNHQQSTARTRNESKLKRAARRERKATKTLAIVLGVFLFCWTPFFAVNIINAMCLRYNLVGTAVPSFAPPPPTAVIVTTVSPNDVGRNSTASDSSTYSGSRPLDGNGDLAKAGSSASRSSTSKNWSRLCDVQPWIFSFLVWLGYINSFLNPVIYTIFNAEFRRAFNKILHRRISRSLACRIAAGTTTGPSSDSTCCCRPSTSPG